jgi:2-polyprenyl-3-methyl-5-hydroxy-6-metoxy-1,4-benzoquinol methylase
MNLGSSESADVENYFDETAEQFAARYGKSAAFRERLDIWERFIRDHSGSVSKTNTCLDIGCGNGVLGRIAASQGYRVYGFDQSVKMLDIACQKAESEKLSDLTEYIKATLPFPKEIMERFSNQGDLLICSSVVEYVTDYETVFEQFGRMVRPGGKLLVSFPNRGSIYRRLERAVQNTPLAKLSYLQHQRHQFELAQVVNLLTSNGFKTIEHRYMALPLQRYTSFVFGNYRPAWLATLFIVAAVKDGR